MEDKTKKSKMWLVALLAIIIIGVVVGVFLLKNSSNPKTVFINQINKTIDNYGSNTTEVKDKMNLTMSLSGKIETDNEQIKPIAQYLNDGKITLNVQADTNAKKELVALDVDYQNEKLVSGNVYYQNDNNIYFFVDGLFDKYLKADLSKNEKQFEQFKSLLNGETMSLVNNDSFRKTERIIKREIKENLEEKYFSKENVDGMTKNTMKMTVGELKQVVTTIIKNLENDKEYINSFEKPDDQVKVLEEALEALKQLDEYEKYELEISIFTKGANNTQKIEMIVKASEKENVTFTIDKVDENTFKFNLNVKMEENNMPISAEALNGTIKIEKVDQNTKNMTIEVENIPDLGKVTLNIGTKLEENTKLDSIDVSNSVDVENMSQADQRTLSTNLTKMKIYTLFAPLMGE